MKNVAVIGGDDHSPRLRAQALDAVVIVNAYHEFTSALDDKFVRRTASTGEYFQSLVVAERPLDLHADARRP